MFDTEIVELPQDRKINPVLDTLIATRRLHVSFAGNLKPIDQIVYSLYYPLVMIPDQTLIETLDSIDSTNFTTVVNTLVKRIKTSEIFTTDIEILLCNLSNVQFRTLIEVQIKTILRFALIVAMGDFISIRQITELYIGSTESAQEIFNDPELKPLTYLVHNSLAVIEKQLKYINRYD